MDVRLHIRHYRGSCAQSSTENGQALFFEPGLGAAGRTRTPNLLIRSQTLCPFELRPRAGFLDLGARSAPSKAGASAMVVGSEGYRGSKESGLLYQSGRQRGNILLIIQTRERWPSGRRRSPAKRVGSLTSLEGSNPSLSAQKLYCRSRSPSVIRHERPVANPGVRLAFQFFIRVVGLLLGLRSLQVRGIAK